MVDLKTVVPNASQYGAKLAYTTYEAEQGELKNGIVESQSSSKETGDKVTITNIDSTPVGIDLVDLEKAPDAIRQPENSVNITDFGAVANDGSDDYQAFMAAVESAKASKKSVYIPEGQFDFSRPISLYVPDGIKITGAGQWHTKLHFLNTEAAKYDDKGYVSGGGGITFEPGSKDIDLGNLSMDSNLNSRHDEKANYKGISGTLGTGSSIHDIKIEHFEVGVWTGDYSTNKPLNYTDGLTISNATIRNNFADGVNFAQGTSNSTVINSNIRGNGDDGLATWSSNHENTNAHVAENNRFLNNTVELGWRAAGIGIFGGKGHEVANNLIKDNANWGGVRLNTVFKNSHNFDLNDTGISVHDNLLVNNGTNADTYGRVKGSIDLEEGRDYATPEKDILGELNNIKIENNTIVNNLSDQEITKTRNPKEGNIPEPVNETTLTIENNHSLSVAENTSAKNVAEVDDHSLTQAANHLGADNIITITDSSHTLVSGGDGNDRIRGGLGNDTINGDSGNDIIFGYDGDDRLNGGIGNDSVHGGNGNDTLWGESGDDRLNGGDGNDVLFGGQGTDYLVGDKGADTYVFSLGEGKDTITDNVGEHNALQFGQNISVNDLHIDAITDVRGNIDWKITIKGSEGDSITINDQFVSGNTNNAVIDTFRFDEGTLSLQELMGRLSGNGNISNLSDVNKHTERMSYSSVDTVDVHDDTASTANAGII